MRRKYKISEICKKHAVVKRKYKIISESCTNHTVMRRKYNIFHGFCEAGDDYLISKGIINSVIGTSNNYRITSNDEYFQLSTNFTLDVFCFKRNHPLSYRLR